MYSSVVRSIALSKTLKCERKKKKEHLKYTEMWQNTSPEERLSIKVFLVTRPRLSPWQPARSLLCASGPTVAGHSENQNSHNETTLLVLSISLAFPWAVPVRTLLKPDIRYHWYVNILLKWCEPDLVPCPSGAAERTLSREGQRRQGHYRVVIWTNER